jgi:pilus assembly protein Flp/PilA
MTNAMVKTGLKFLPPSDDAENRGAAPAAIPRLKENLMLGLLVAFMAGRLNLDEKGATAVEYGLLAALVAVAIIVAVTLLGTNLSALFNDIAGEVAP